MKFFDTPLRKNLSRFKENILLKRQLPVGYINKSLNFIFRKIFRYEHERDYELNYLNNYFTNKYAISPIQKDEAIFLFGLLKVVRPGVCIEFGFNYGHSSYLILNAIEKNARLYSFDILDESEDIANKYF
jgi:predicted O-methyltransferase YrrM